CQKTPSEVLPARSPSATTPPSARTAITRATLPTGNGFDGERAARFFLSRFLSAFADFAETGAMTGGAERPGLGEGFGCSSTKSSSSGESFEAAGDRAGGGGAGGGRASTKSKLTSAASCWNAGGCPASNDEPVCLGARSVSSTSLFGVSAVSSSSAENVPELDGANAASSSESATACGPPNAGAGEPWSFWVVETDGNSGVSTGEANGSTSSDGIVLGGGVGAEAKAGDPGRGTAELPPLFGARGAGCADAPVPGSGTFVVTALRSPAFGR